MNGRFTTSQGTQVVVKRLDLSMTYGDVLEGTPEMATRMFRRSLEQRVRARFWDEAPIVLLDDGADALPPFRCIAHFWSSSPTRDLPGHDYADLVVCWFLEEFPVDLVVEIQSLLQRVDWAAAARDGSWDDL